MIGTIDILRYVTLPIWIALIFVMMPGAWRVMRQRPRPLDMLWLGGSMLAANRVAFQINTLLGSGGWLQIWCYASAFGGAVAWLAIVRGYQRHDW